MALKNKLEIPTQSQTTVDKSGHLRKTDISNIGINKLMAVTSPSVILLRVVCFSLFGFSSGVLWASLKLNQLWTPPPIIPAMMVASAIINVSALIFDFVLFYNPIRKSVKIIEDNINNLEQNNNE